MLHTGKFFFCVLEFKNQPIFSPLDGAKCRLSCEVGQHSQSKVTLARFGWKKGERKHNSKHIGLKLYLSIFNIVL